MILGVVDSGVYNFFKWLHILCAIVGFGAVMLNGVYGAQAGKREGAARTAILEANHLVSEIGTYFIYAVFLLGFVLIGLSDKAWKMSQVWVWLAILIYIAALGVAHGVLRPGLKKMIALSKQMEAGPTPELGAQLGATAKRMAPFGAINDVAVLVILYLMVFKPGL